MAGISKERNLEVIRKLSGGKIGARKGDILIAPGPTFNGFAIQIEEDQDLPIKYQKNVAGLFVIVFEGKRGKYGKYFEKLIGVKTNSNELRNTVNKMELKDGKPKPQFTYATAQDIMGIQCPNCRRLQLHLDACGKCSYVRGKRK